MLTRYQRKTTNFKIQFIIMKKQFCLILLLSVFGLVSIAQVTIKKPLSAEDDAYFNKQLQKQFTYISSISFSYKSDDLYDPSNIVGDKPADANEILILEKKLKGNYDDAVIYNQIGNICKRLLRYEEAEKKFTKALERANEMILVEGDSASSYEILGTIHMNMNNFIEAAIAYEKAHELDPKNEMVKCMTPMLYMFAGDLNRMLAAIQKDVKESPSQVSSYFSYPLYFYYSLLVVMQQSQGDQRDKLLKNKSVDDILDLTILKDGIKNNENNVQFELLLNVTRHLITSAKVMINATGDTTMMAKDYKFPIDAFDKTEFENLEKYYKTCFKDDRITNKYFVNRALANIYLMQNRSKEAIPLLEKAIALKPISKCKLMNNTAEEYESLAYAYITSGDTAAYKKTIRKKFKDRPTIDPLATDYVTMGMIAYKEKKDAEAEKYLKEAIALGDKEYITQLLLGAVELNKKNIDAALKYLDAAFQIDKQDYTLYYLMGICYLHKNDAISAQYCFDKANKLTTSYTRLDPKLMDRFFTGAN
jgi:tetratricopeptide (TPR) repeat protein